jgi:hypothetical protein
VAAVPIASENQIKNSEVPFFDFCNRKPKTLEARAKDFDQL